MTIYAGGQFVGQAAALLGDITPGTNGFFTGYSGQLGEHQRVTVAGKNPDSGFVFAHRLLDGAIVQMPSDGRPGTQYVGAFNFVNLRVSCPKDNIPTAVDTIGELASGKFFDTGDGTSPPGRMGRTVTVFEVDGVTPIAPDAGKVWRLMFDGTEVEQVVDSTSIESYGDSAADSWQL